jgi:thiamine-monophosphate kinase
MHFLISIAAPPDLEWKWFEEFFNGVESACQRFEISLIGGDSSSSDRIFVDVSMVGRVPVGRAVRRSGAKVGDTIYVTGQLGGSILGLERLKSGSTSDPAVQRHLYPEPRFRVGPAVTDRAHAMIDVSDGLSTDLSHILEESDVCGRIYKDRLPAWPGAEDRYILHGGEEYELIITGPAGLPSEIEGVKMTAIGQIMPSDAHNQLFIVDGAGESILTPHGWAHFQ